MATAPHLATVVGAALYSIARVESLKTPTEALLIWEKLTDKQKAPYMAAAQWLNQQPPGCLTDRDALAMRLFDSQKKIAYNPRLAVEMWMSLRAAFRAG